MDNLHGEWAKRDDGRLHCNYCGSITTAEAIRLLTIPGTKFSGSDWKYGWPHKYYIEPNGEYLKFYNIHLRDASDDEVVRFGQVSLKCFGILWGRNEKGVYYRAPKSDSFYGFQMWGNINAEGEPDHSTMNPHFHFDQEVEPDVNVTTVH